jgi:DNA-binding transcriptional ArsR family regulator
MTQDINRLKRIGWGTRGVFALGIAASLAGNVLHAADNPVSKAISAWSPLALLLTVELISRIPTRRGLMTVARLGATAVIAGIAAWVSYWHMAGVAARYGETGASPYLLPFSVDGLIVVASISLVEIGGRIRRLALPAVPVTEPAPAAAEPATPEPVPAETPAPAAPVKKAPAKRVTPRPASASKVAKVAARMPGASVAEIARKAEVSPSTVRRHLAALRVTDASPSAPVPAETPALAAA